MNKSVEEIAAIAVDCGLQIHKDLGPGLLESAYEFFERNISGRSKTHRQQSRPNAILIA